MTICNECQSAIDGDEYTCAACETTGLCLDCFEAFHGEGICTGEEDEDADPDDDTDDEDDTPLGTVVDIADYMTPADDGDVDYEDEEGA